MSTLKLALLLAMVLIFAVVVGTAMVIMFVEHSPFECLNFTTIPAAADDPTSTASCKLKLTSVSVLLSNIRDVTMHGCTEYMW